GRALAALGRRVEATEAFREVVRLNPRTDAARTEFARLRVRDDAADAVLAATAAHARGLDARLTLARTLVQKQDDRQARHILEDVIRVAPDVAAAHAQLGVVLARAQEVDGA